MMSWLWNTHPCSHFHNMATEQCADLVGLHIPQAAQITSAVRTGNEQPYCLPRLTNARTRDSLILVTLSMLRDDCLASFGITIYIDGL
uniref:HDC10830 n=1 Tax=Drosophila melanogaster TaxID=7227 RepID=Q6IL12_DROME|nr:TPA_inf: HDC10830 [Drosophila melanogaster]